ncbi:MAG TPA: substrate-binding domain-containing protein [Terriglobales bacterium]|nr:substrate-binding domain-containing protein [Terriglobales bacterium]
MLRQGVLALMLAIAGSAPLAAKDIAVVSNKTNSAITIAMPELIKICKGQISRWPDGKPLTFVTRDPGSTDMKVVLEKVYGMSKEEVSAMIAAANHGRTNHPAIMVVSSDEDLVNKVENMPGAIGLVDVYSINGGVTVIKVGGKLPLEPGYPLHGN